MTEIKSNVVFPYNIKFKGSNSLIVDALLYEIDPIERKFLTMDKIQFYPETFI